MVMFAFASIKSTFVDDTLLNISEMNCNFTDVYKSFVATMSSLH